jgi:hypothetical protein
MTEPISNCTTLLWNYHYKNLGSQRILGLLTTVSSRRRLKMTIRDWGNVYSALRSNRVGEKDYGLLGSKCCPSSNACARRIVINPVNEKILLRFTGRLGLCATYNFNMLHKILSLLLLLFIFTANSFLPGGSGNTIRHNKQITHITQNNTMIKRNTVHKTTHTIKNTLHRMNTINHN